MPSLFLSHSTQDKPLARRIAHDVERAGIGVWLDEWRILVGDSISQHIAHGLDEVEFVAVLLTRDSIESGWVEKEWQAKIGQEASERRVVILPLKADDCEIPVLLRDKKYADFQKDYDSGITELVKAIKGHSERSSLDESAPVGNNTATPKYICYMSFGKIEMLYSQMAGHENSPIGPNANEQEPITGELVAFIRSGPAYGLRGLGHIADGELDPMQKLIAVFSRLDAAGEIRNLNKGIELGSIEAGANCFVYSGSFRCLEPEHESMFERDNSDYLAKVEQESSLSPRHFTGLKATSRMCVMSSNCHQYQLFLACSMKYFSNMGGKRVVVGDGEDLVDIHPHSGNYHFFSGDHDAQFDALVFLTGQKGQSLYGSPLVLVNSFSPDLTI